ncbi:uncharacterized protein SCHCODRAFT_02518861 [Schizophyllum commune H4-8]|uniref:F-box domain-containing protein n=1 Tax=Schizophyllum commune (strain H4-8 / FGSC 9210) TaxID=578458 RepID=D8QI56_SCHCM|nr:uncharacterized protein SCHCODRAFT_02518861 [Schizophyllum commune H4-8]KAI5885866.1 hypothetical protein SCHCODRAFT_02518861 [Schizophyllum commune H4-8]
MHAALQTTELVLDILSHLEHVDLAAVARTCSRLSGPALSQIWKHICGLEHILDLLPGGKISLEKTPVHQYHVAGSTENSDVERVKYYAGFVRSWALRPSIDDISTQDLQKVLAGLRGQTLFPNLRKFTYLGPSPCAPLLLSVIGPSVTSLQLWYSFGAELGVNARPEDVDYSAERDLLLAIKERKPRAPVTTLSLSVDLPCTEFVRSVLTDWDELEDLSLYTDCVDPPMIMTFPALPRLKKLMLYIAVNGFHRSPLAVQPSFASASALSSLYLCGESVKDALSILRPISLSELILDGKLAASDFRDICAHMRKIGIPSSLQKMTFRQSRPNEDDEAYAREALLMQHIQPLFFYQNLTEVMLVFVITSLTDDDIGLLACSWPHLRSLCIETTGTTRPLITLSGILAFAQYCPYLEFLRLPVDATKICVPDSANVPFPRAHRRLRTLYIDESPIFSPGMVASFLTRFFPGIRPEGLTTGKGPASNKRAKMWTDVRTLIPLFLDARMTGIHGGMNPM